MENEEDYTELFIRKIKTQTSIEEDKMIDKMFLENPGLKLEFEEIKALSEAVKLYEYQKEAEEYFKRKDYSGKVVAFSQILRKAAVFLLFLGASFLGYLTFSDNYLPGINPDAGMVRSAGGSTKPIPLQLSKQELAFKNFMMGQAYYSSKEFPKAIEMFEDAIATPDLRNKMREALEWHLCVAYLSDNQPRKAEYWMNEIDKIKEPKYKISSLSKLKVRWQILVKAAFS